MERFLLNVMQTVISKCNHEMKITILFHFNLFFFVIPFKWIHITVYCIRYSDVRAINADLLTFYSFREERTRI